MTFNVARCYESNFLAAELKFFFALHAKTLSAAARPLNTTPDGRSTSGELPTALKSDQRKLGNSLKVHCFVDSQLSSVPPSSSHHPQIIATEKSRDKIIYYACIMLFVVLPRPMWKSQILRTLHFTDTKNVKFHR